jgi:hypothetical protein
MNPSGRCEDIRLLQILRFLIKCKKTLKYQNKHALFYLKMEK